MTVAAPLRMRIRRDGLPVPPVEFADEVELWARQSGRHAKIEFRPTMVKEGRVEAGCWVVRISLKPDDRRMLLYRRGQAPEPPTEDVWLHVPDNSSSTGYRAFDLGQLGTSGVRQFLERGDTWSGRGEFRSIDEQARLAMDANERMREKHRAFEKEESRHEQRAKRRWRLGIPLVPGVDLPKVAGPTSTPDLAPAATKKEKVS
jgi:hypothetical protein